MDKERTGLPLGGNQIKKSIQITANLNECPEQGWSHVQACCPNPIPIRQD
jgi:hypothetical protein